MPLLLTHVAQPSCSHPNSPSLDELSDQYAATHISIQKQRGEVVPALQSPIPCSSPVLQKQLGTFHPLSLIKSPTAPAWSSWPSLLPKRRDVLSSMRQGRLLGKGGRSPKLCLHRVWVCCVHLHQQCGSSQRSGPITQAFPSTPNHQKCKLGYCEWLRTREKPQEELAAPCHFGHASNGPKVVFVRSHSHPD